MGSNVLNQAKINEMIAETNAALPEAFRHRLEARPVGKRVCEIAIKGFKYDTQGIVRSLRECSAFLAAWKAAVAWCKNGGEDVWREIAIVDRGAKFWVVEIGGGPKMNGRVYASFPTKMEADAYACGMIAGT